MRRLRGRTAVLTGASRGIGRTVAIELAVRGVNLVLIARSQPDLARVRSIARAAEVDVDIEVGDLSVVAECQRLSESIRRTHDRVDILINNAGMESVRDFVSLADAEIIETVQVNLVAPILLTRAFLPGMLERECGHVVNVSSLAGKGARRSSNRIRRRNPVSSGSRKPCARPIKTATWASPSSARAG